MNPHNPKEKDLVLQMKDRGLLEWIVLSDLKKETLNLKHLNLNHFKSMGALMKELRAADPS